MLRRREAGCTLLSDLEALLASGGNSLKHLVGTDVRLEVARIPQLAEQLAESLHCNTHTHTHTQSHREGGREDLPRMKLWSPGAEVMCE